MINLNEVNSRWQLARMAGEHVDDGGHNPDAQTFRAVAASAQDVPLMHDELKILRQLADAVDNQWVAHSDGKCGNAICITIANYRDFKRKHENSHE